MFAGQGGFEIVSVEAPQTTFVDHRHAQFRQPRKIPGLFRASLAKGQAGHDLFVLKIGLFQIQAKSVLVHHLDNTQVFHHKALVDLTGFSGWGKIGKCSNFSLLGWFYNRAQALVEYGSDGCFGAFGCG